MKDLTPEEEAEINEALRRKTGIMIAIPNMGAKINTPLSQWLQSLSFRTVDSECPWFFRVHMPNDLTPHEFARNECVREFLKDPFYKRLWFIDSDMIPPGDAIDLLDHDEPLVSGMTYIWNGESADRDGFYRPPIIKIHGFTYRPHPHDDFVSIVPGSGQKTFYCDATGAACLVIKREVLEALPEPWFRTIRDPYGKLLRSEDLDFGKRLFDRGIRTLYVATNEWGHLKEIDLKQVTRYGLNAMRGVIQKVKESDPALIAKQLPDIQFSGERPKKEQAGDVPMKLEVVQGGRV